MADSSTKSGRDCTEISVADRTKKFRNFTEIMEAEIKDSEKMITHGTYVRRSGKLVFVGP